MSETVKRQQYSNVQCQERPTIDDTEIWAMWKKKKTSEIKSSQKLRQLVRYAQRRMPQILYIYIYIQVPTRKHNWTNRENCHRWKM